MAGRHLIASFLFTFAGVLVEGGVAHDVLALKIAGMLLVIGAYGFHEGV